MRKFDPWPVFFRREWNRNWPFLVGFAITGAVITKLTYNLTEEDAKNSAFVQRHRSMLLPWHGLLWHANLVNFWKLMRLPDNELLS